MFVLDRPGVPGLCGSEAAPYVCTAHFKAVYGASGTRGNAGHRLADALTRLAVRPAEQKGQKYCFSNLNRLSPENQSNSSPRSYVRCPG